MEDRYTEFGSENQCFVRVQILTSMSITGTSMRTPTTVARDAPEDITGDNAEEHPQRQVSLENALHFAIAVCSSAFVHPIGNMTAAHTVAQKII